MTDQQKKLVKEFLHKMFIYDDKNPLPDDIEKALDLLEDHMLKSNGIMVID